MQHRTESLNGRPPRDNGCTCQYRVLIVNQQNEKKTALIKFRSDSLSMYVGFGEKNEPQQKQSFVINQCVLINCHVSHHSHHTTNHKQKCTEINHHSPSPAAPPDRWMDGSINRIIYLTVRFHTSKHITNGSELCWNANRAKNAICSWLNVHLFLYLLYTQSKNGSPFMSLSQSPHNHECHRVQSAITLSLSWRSVSVTLNVIKVSNHT